MCMIITPNISVAMQTSTQFTLPRGKEALDTHLNLGALKSSPVGGHPGLGLDHTGVTSQSTPHHQPHAVHQVHQEVLPG